MESLTNLIRNTLLLGISALLIGCSEQSDVSGKIQDKLRDYYVPKKDTLIVYDYNSLVREAINSSKEKPVIIVDKFDYSLKLFYLGVLIKEYPIELGNPKGDKEFQGDRKTPEGNYRITWKRYEDIGQTQYYKALLLDYPNETDKVEFKKMKMLGEIPQGAKIGRLIEIHGHGSGRKGNDTQGRGNWTDGCVALSNNNMDDLFRYVGEGNLVTIVNSVH
jgi:murein L,D-transpeptidase YafK